ncbi:TRAP transporter small permease [Donghicola sp. C2-DW-16]|uniref:TRAP transporter small permease protein n=2 Tax=Donghicola mangrovi TaxID=2729614 RepID=A0A850Q4S9_9RHOB|nr:TRAP transporter small permease [Donghicola mangrovi]NVO27478.1 TRAP transporter small permease [Donghicola mangrovi]
MSMDQHKSPVWLEASNRATLVLAAISGVLLLGMLVLVFVAVFARYIFGTPILGVNEVVQLTSVGVVMLALPFATAIRSHVSVDVLDNAIGPVGRFVGDVQSRILSSLVLSVLVHRSWLKALDAYEFTDTTNMLGLPIWPFYGAIAAGMALCVVVLLLQLVAILTGKLRL